MRTLRIVSVVGARPNFMKIAPFIHAIRAHNARPRRRVQLDHRLVHTGQHYDPEMSQAFFKALRIPRPDVNLEIGSGSHAEQVGRTMMAFERVVRDWRPDWVVVVGDVNATCACAITAKKEHLALAHIEAGLRSFDIRMPEEVNRIVTDRLSDLLFTPDRFGDTNLKREGVPASRIRRVGNIMIDTLDAQLPAARRLDPGRIVARRALAKPSRARQRKWADRSYAVLTLHRPSNTDNPQILHPLVDYLLNELAPALPLVWAIHPRARKQLELFGLWQRVLTSESVFVVEPLGYHEMLRLNAGARLLLTDSGGLQEECCILGTPCITLRDTTERPITLRRNGGVSELAGADVARVRRIAERMLRAPRKPVRPPLWDGHTAERIVQELATQA